LAQYFLPEVGQTRLPVLGHFSFPDFEQISIPVLAQYFLPDFGQTRLPVLGHFSFPVSEHTSIPVSGQVLHDELLHEASTNEDTRSNPAILNKDIFIPIVLVNTYC